MTERSTNAVDRTNEGIYLAPSVWHGHSEWPKGRQEKQLTARLSVYKWLVYCMVVGKHSWFVGKPTLQF